MNKNILFYFFSISIGSTAYQVVSIGMNNLHWAYAGFLFSILSWVSVLILHKPTLYLLKVKIRPDDIPDKTWTELSKDEIVSILFLGISSFLNFAIMLPFLKNQENAIYFIIVSSALVRIINIYAAQKLFDDKIGNNLLFWLGFMLCIIGIFLFKYRDFTNGILNYNLILYSSIWGVIGVINEQTQRFITIKHSERKINIKFLSKTYLSIKTQREKTELIRTILFLSTAIVIYFYKKNTLYFSTPTGTELGCALWVGYAVTILGGTIALRYKNKIGETVASIIQSFRVIVSMLLVPLIVYILTDNDPIEIWRDKWKWAGVFIVSLGSFIGLFFGKPTKGGI